MTLGGQHSAKRVVGCQVCWVEEFRQIALPRRQCPLSRPGAGVRHRNRHAIEIENGDAPLRTVGLLVGSLLHRQARTGRSRGHDTLHRGINDRMTVLARVIHNQTVQRTALPTLPRIEG